jgi:hypothetical protein
MIWILLSAAGLVAGLWLVVGLCAAAARPLPRPPSRACNRRGRRLARLLKVNGGLK